jgi:two-component system, OmpR family, sensor histidine kinase VicK
LLHYPFSHGHYLQYIEPNVIFTRASWGENSHIVSLVFEPTASVLVYGDRERINQVIENLLNNAVKFTEYGIITKTVEKNNHNNEVSVTVKDTGAGIDKDILPRLFMKYATKSKQGTGLGLFISKGLVEAHGGRIEAYNNVDGPGAAFRFTISLVS